jgi:uncharacterized peroxidase-related enzyme
MAHIALPEGIPGIVGPLMQFPETGRPLLELAETLLRSPSTLTPAEREMIALHVSSRNDCYFCAHSHAAAARHLLDEADRGLVDAVWADPEGAAISPKLRALLGVAAKVQQGGQCVLPEDVAQARAEGATDREIHDTVLIAAAFCMYNRYVDGLATWAPQDEAAYDQMGADMAREGYLRERSY